MRGKLHTPVRPASTFTLAKRIGLLFVLIISTVLVMHFEGGLLDAKTGEPPTLLDSIYFTMVTITTVGYGDIVPVTPLARTLDAFFLTPMRFIFIALFIGIAYEVSLKRIQEEYRMNRVVSELHGHIIVCGYGETGRLTVNELLKQGTDPSQIVVVDKREPSLELASRRNVVTIHGDASQTGVLKSVALDRAAYVLICPGRDDTAVLITLTVLDIRPDARTVVMMHERENIRLARRAGAQTIITQAAGHLMAAATRRPHLSATMKDLIEVGGTMRLNERPVQVSEVGKLPRDIEDISVVRIYRDGYGLSARKCDGLQSGDVLVYVEDVEGGEPSAVS